MSHAPVFLITSIISLLWTGCGTLREHAAVPPDLQQALLSADRADSTTLIRHVDHDGIGLHENHKPLKNILVLSGGGRNGAFSAGVLVGWSELGDRPRFDVVTGVSIGALIAPFAFLGEDCNEELRRLFTSESATHVYRLSPFVPWSKAAASSHPLRQQIRNLVTDDLVERIAIEHIRGRRLYVGTTNLDSQRGVIWDLGAIAAGDDPNRTELVQNILLASCSVPGLLPPIEIDVQIDGRQYSELHVDGGVSASMFLLPQSVDFSPQEIFQSGGSLDQPSSRASVYVIVAGKTDPDSIMVKNGLLQISGASLAGVLRAQQDHDLMRIYMLTYFANASFQLAGIPKEFHSDSNSMEFDMRTMRALFEEGYRFGKSSTGWMDRPPLFEPNRGRSARTGTKLASKST